MNWRLLVSGYKLGAALGALGASVLVEYKVGRLMRQLP